MRCPDGAGGRSEVALVASSPPLSLPGDLSVSQAGTAQPAAGQCWPGPSRGSPPPAGRTLRPAALTPGRAQRFWRSGRAQRGAGGGPDSARPGTAETVPPTPGLGTTGMAPGLGLQRCDSSCHCPWAFCPPCCHQRGPNLVPRAWRPWEGCGLQQGLSQSRHGSHH